MRFKAGGFIPPTIIRRSTIARMAKDRGLTLTDDELQIIERFLNVMDRPEKIRQGSNCLNASEAEFLESLGIRV